MLDHFRQLFFLNLVFFFNFICSWFLSRFELYLLCKSWSSFRDISSIWAILDFNSCNSFLSSSSSKDVSCFLFLDGIHLKSELFSSILFILIHFISPCDNILGSLDDFSAHLVRPNLTAVVHCVRWDCHLEIKGENIWGQKYRYFTSQVPQPTCFWKWVGGTNP